MRRLAALALAFAALPALAQEVPVPQKRPSQTQTRPAEALIPPPGEPAPQEKAAPPADSAAPAGPPAADAAARARLRWTACPALMSGAVTGRLGEPVEDGDCGVESPVLVTAIGGVKLSSEATMTCAMASALATYVPKLDAAARDAMGSPLAGLVTGSGYECRNRNRSPTAKLSQHAFANALDIMAFLLSDGRSVSLLSDWPQPPNAGKEGPPVAQRAETPQAKFLAAAHSAACPLFTTVLGPDADPEHRDNLHLDLGCHGRDCSYMICQ
ncbi:MAG: extensin family protein [Nitratireductor sp.]|jgi:hypothetical protein|nr:extensin family protein [Nitratireductor sp.]